MKDFSALEWLIIRNITVSEAIMNVIMAVACIAVILSMWKLHRRNGQYKNFNVVSLVVNKDGFPDGAKCIEMGAFLILSWGFIAYVLAGNWPSGTCNFTSACS